MIKVDASGAIAWSKAYGGIEWDEVWSGRQTTDGGYIVAGETRSFGAGMEDVYLIKTNSSGNISWSRAYGGSRGDFGYSVEQCADLGYIVAGGTDSFGAGNRDVLLVKTDERGLTCTGVVAAAPFTETSPSSTTTAPTSSSNSAATVENIASLTTTEPPTEVTGVCESVPTMSQWGLFFFVLLLISAAVWVLRREGRVAGFVS